MGWKRRSSVGSFTSKVELRVLREGIAHLVVPREHHKDAKAALAWVETLFREAD